MAAPALAAPARLALLSSAGPIDTPQYCEVFLSHYRAQGIAARDIVVHQPHPSSSSSSQPHLSVQTAQLSAVGRAQPVTPSPRSPRRAQVVPLGLGQAITTPRAEGALGGRPPQQQPSAAKDAQAARVGGVALPLTAAERQKAAAAVGGGGRRRLLPPGARRRAPVLQ